MPKDTMINNEIFIALCALATVHERMEQTNEDEETAAHAIIFLFLANKNPHAMRQKGHIIWKRIRDGQKYYTAGYRRGIFATDISIQMQARMVYPDAKIATILPTTYFYPTADPPARGFVLTIQEDDYAA